MDTTTPSLKKKNAWLRGTFSHFAARTRPPGPILGRPDGPGVDFGRQNASIFEVSRSAGAFGANFVRNVQNVGRSYEFGTSEHSRDKTKTMKIRSDDVSDFACRVAHTPTSSRTGPGASWDRPGLAL